MAYNREWDRGKGSSWNEGGSWQDNSYGSNVRGRDDDYYSEGKRRKFNNGGYDNTQGYDKGGYDGGYGHPQSDIKKRIVASEPSPHVIFLGLEPTFTEADLQAYLISNNCSIESVTIIRDRETGVSKGFGFAHFTSVEHARAFVDPRFPFINVPPPASAGIAARDAYFAALDTGRSLTTRKVKIDYSQSAGAGGKPVRPVNTNDGTRDIGNTQAPVLLFRGLDPLSGPQAIAQAMLTSSGLGKEGAKGMKRIILIKDKVTLTSWGFAFVEFVDVASAAAVLAATMSAQIHPSGFRISDRPVAASFAHPYSFQPLPDYTPRDDACMPSSMALGGVEGTHVRYWDEASTAAVLEFKVEAPAEPAPTTTEKKKEKKKKAVDDVKPVEASTLPVSDKPVTLSFKGGFGAKSGPVAAPIAGPVKKPLNLGISLEEEEAEGETGDEKSTAEDPKVPTLTRGPPPAASKKMMNNITKWNQVQEELKVETSAAPAVVAAVPGPSKATPPAVTAPSKSTTPVPAADQEFEFADTNAMTCLLCARQFKSLDVLRRHNKESELHKKNYKDASLRDVAREKANAARAKSEQPKYRDRASERRIMHNQPDVPLPEVVAKPATKRHAEGPPPPPTPPPPPLNPGEDENNVGNKLLKMMGWKEGTGLGTDGEGRVEPIQTAIYAQGAGLGASKGKEIGKYADGYSGYVHMAQDAARERYGS